MAIFARARAQFLAEARVLARCHHAGIVSVHTAFEANSTAYMVMELLHGQTLAQLLGSRRGCMPEVEAVAIIERVGEALQFVHAQNLLHRDIKPDNIIACDDGRVMLIDFGTARETVQNQVQGQTVVVTPGYAPLEQYARQARRGAFTDIYSLAATLYHLLSGQMPPAASDRAMGVQLRPVREFNPHISASVARAVERALQMEIARRPQSVREFLDLLHAPVEEITPALQAATKRGDLLTGNDAEVKALFSPTRANSPSVALFSDALQEGQTQLGNLLPDLNEDASKPLLNPSPVALFSDAQQDHQTLVGNLLPPASAQPVRLAPARAFPLAANPPKASTTATAAAGSGAGGVNVKNKVRSNKSSGIAWGMFAGFVLIVGLFALVRPRSNEKFASPSASGDSSRGSTALGDTSMPSVFQRREQQVTATREKAKREWEAIPPLLPVSVQTLPDSKNTNSPQDSKAKREHFSRGYDIEFSPDGKRLAYIDSQAVLRVMSVPDLKIVSSLALDKSRTSVAPMLSADNNIIAVTQTSALNSDTKLEPTNRVDVWNLRSGKRLGTFVGDATDELSLQAVLNNGQILVQVRSKLKYLLWNPTTGARNESPKSRFSGIDSVVVAPNQKELVYGDRSGVLHWINRSDGKQKFEYNLKLTWRDHYNRFGDYEDSLIYPNPGVMEMPLEVRRVKYSTNGKWLVSRNASEITVFNDKAKKVAALSIYGREDFAIAPDGKWLVASSVIPMTNGRERELLWNVKTGQKN